MPLVVSDAAATVRPWKPPWNTMMLGRPVACRARRSAASTASLAGVREEHPVQVGGSTSLSPLHQGE